MAWFFVLLFLDAKVNLFTVDSDFLGRIDTNTHLITLHSEHGHGNLTVTNDQAFRAPTSQNQQTFLLTPLFRDNSLQTSRHRPVAQGHNPYLCID